MAAPTASKKPTNLSLSADLLLEARALDINLSAALDEALAGIIRKRRAEVWLEENRAAMDAYNDHVERHGVFSDGLRGF
ncbi:MAG: type II toxin-antitoxin system CcdA family antitoxin [Acidobacteria bacterium]|nr:type II toxin-antitoxin system CcdA family antitoxin [Acidobacteriota bacterium]